MLIILWDQLIMPTIDKNTCTVTLENTPKYIDPVFQCLI